MLRTSLNQYAVVTHLKIKVPTTTLLPFQKVSQNMTGRAANRNIVVTLTMMQIMDMTR